MIAVKAYHISLGGKAVPVLSGLSGDQHFDITYMQSWREIWADGRTRRIVLFNPQPAEIPWSTAWPRNDDWYAAFPQVKPYDAYYLSPEQRVHLCSVRPVTN